MDFLDWCGWVLKKIVEAGRVPHLDEIRLAQLLYGEEFRTAGGFHHSTHRRGMFDAVRELVNLALVEERTGRFWTVTSQGREFDANPAPLLHRIRSIALEPDEQRILRVVNSLSPQSGSSPPHAWLEWVDRGPLLAEYDITADFDMQEVLWPVSEDLERRGLVYRRALPGWHLDLKSTYSGLAWERRPAQIGEPEMGHVLFLDIVGYSKLLMRQQTETLSLLNDLVRATDEYRRASSERNSLRTLPTGDGMALVFFGRLTAHIRCAIELSRALKQHPDLKLRMGLHSGPVYRVSDINDSSNVAGGGINMAQRVMDCGDAGHILLSNVVAGNLQQLGDCEGKIQDLGEVEVKHGVRVHVYNFVDGELGNPAIPAKLGARRDTDHGGSTPHSDKSSLSPEEVEILIAAADRGEISILSTDETGAWVRAGRRDFIDHSDRAVAAMYLDALRSLLRRGLVTHAGGISYDLTGSGFRQARELERLRDAEISKRKSQAPESQPEKRDVYKLILEVDADDQSQVKSDHHPQASRFKKTEPDVPVRMDLWVLTVNLRIRFENHDIHPIQLKKIKLSLLRKARDGRVREIPLFRSLMEIVEEGTAEKLVPDQNQILGNRITPYYWVRGVLEVSARYGGRLNQNCFLRVTVEALRQPPYSVFLDVDWKTSRKGYVFVTHRKGCLTPRAPAKPPV
jgi:class 3 adenylate cyclase